MRDIDSNAAIFIATHLDRTDTRTMTRLTALAPIGICASAAPLAGNSSAGQTRTKRQPDDDIPDAEPYVWIDAYGLGCETT